MTTATATRTTAAKARLTIADKAEMLLANSATWLRCRNRRTGRLTAYGIPSLTQPHLYHLTNGTVCDCKAGQAGRDCCHRTAAALYIDQRKQDAREAADAAAALLDDDRASFVLWLDAVDRATHIERDVSDLYGAEQDVAA